jgi:hypothetical protein
MLSYTMTLTTALKVKNRLIGQLNKIRQDINTYNATCKDREIDIMVLWANYELAVEGLIKLKTQIALKTAKITPKLVELAEEKSKLAFLNNIPVRTGEEVVPVYYGSGAMTTQKWESFITETKRRELVAKSEEQIAWLQDCIDEYNATTLID